MSKCILKKGEISILIDRDIFMKGSDSALSDWVASCDIENGAIIRIPYEPGDIEEALESKSEQKPDTPQPIAIDPPKKKITKKTHKKVKSSKKSVKKDHKKNIVKETSNDKEIVKRDTKDVPKKIVGTPEQGDTEMLNTPTLIAQVQQPSPVPMADQLSNLAQTTGSDPTLTIILAAMAILGGTTAWKFYRQYAEQKHEERMQKMKLDAKSNNSSSNQSPGACQAVHAQLTTEVTQLKGRLSQVEGQVSINADFDSDRLERRVKKLERWKKDLEEDE